MYSVQVFSPGIRARSIRGLSNESDHSTVHIQHLFHYVELLNDSLTVPICKVNNGLA